MKIVTLLIPTVALLSIGGVLLYSHLSVQRGSSNTASGAPQPTVSPTQAPKHSTGDHEQIFDMPLKTTVLNIAASSHSGVSGKREPSQLRCFAYPNFLIKEFDEHELGDTSISIAYSRDSSSLPCSREKLSSEKEYRDWNGYFSGVKGNLVFIDGAETFNGGQPFLIFDAVSGKKLFEDSWAANKGSRFHIDSGPEGLTMRYTRIEIMGCSLQRSGLQCWNLIRHNTGLNEQSPPKCDNPGAYTAPNADSVISYPAEISLKDFTIRPLRDAGKISCWLAE